jgi:hypothetical protein
MPVTINGSTGLTANDGSVFTNASGNVGVGTSSPTARLHTQVSSGNTIARFVNTTSTAGELGELVLAAPSRPAVRMNFQTSVDSNGFFNYDSGSFVWFNNSGGSATERMRIDTAGRVTTPFQPSFLAGSSAGDTTVTTGSLIPFNSTGTSGFNVGSGYNTASYLFTAPIAGKYFFSCVAYYTNSSGFTNDMQLAPIVNGAQVVVGGDAVVFSSAYPNNTGGTISIGGSFILNLAANDTVGVYNRTGFSVRLYMGHTKFSGYLLG